MTVRITYFVNSTTKDNETGLATGWEPGELSPIGVNQSENLWQLIKNKKIDVVYCSDLKRAVDSAELTFKGNFPLIQDKRLRECDYGDLTKMSSKKVKKNMAKRIDTPFPNGESYKDVEERMRSFIECLKEEHDGEHVAIVAHQAPQLALDVILKGKSWVQAIKEDWRNKHNWKPGWEYIIE